MLWNIEQNNPVCHAHALRVRSALYSMTGFLYQGPIAVHGKRREKNATSQRTAMQVALLASDATRHITGTEVWIDGGSSLVQG